MSVAYVSFSFMNFLIGFLFDFLFVFSGFMFLLFSVVYP